MSKQNRSPSVLIVGAGIGGIATAIELRRHGFDDIRILEAADGLGGTWYYNSYPGAACDVPSHLYSFSFAQRRDWSRLCSPQEEILSYLRGVARDHGVEALVQFGTEVRACTWSDESRCWSVSSTDGRTWAADAVVIATGQLNQPAVPRIEGADTFAGHSFHSARWDHGYDLSGKRVAVVGTGASAVQFVPELARTAGRLTVFQRTGNWFLPRRNRAYPPLLQAVIQYVPGVQALRRRYMYHYVESLTAQIRNPETIGRIGALYSSLFMRRQLRDPEVRRKAWPNYTFGCKRILFSSYYLPTLQRPNVELVTDRIERMTPAGIATSDGVEREFDCVIWGTGFHTDHFMFPMEVTGTRGRSLRETWADGAHAHLGIAVPGFPSLFMIYGPNTNTSGGSIVLYEETQAAYIRQALELVRDRCVAAIDVRPEVEAASDREVQARFAGTAWTRCDSWYRDATGRIITNWPGYMREYEARLERIDASEYSFVPMPEREQVPA
jgi:cation diffusion facilitator CzcD-associated flavoprotein CzcO